MQTDEDRLRRLIFRDLIEALIRFALVVFLVVLCAWVFDPFAQLALWALILAVALYPLHQRLARRFNGRQGLAAAVIVVGFLVLLGVPMAMMGDSVAHTAGRTYAALENDTLAVLPPDPGVADWPLVGEQVYAAWSAAAEDLPGYLQSRGPQVREIAGSALERAADAASAMLLFVGALIVAGIMMAYGEPGSQAVRRIASRLTTPGAGARLQALSTATVRSVATGVIGVAVIQALLLGVGFFLAGIPAASLLSLVVLLIGIVQLPALIISLPAIVYLWAAGDASVFMNVVWSVYLVLAGMADNVLKPLLLGRGVDAPMPVVLIGALGGMVVGGIGGLFLGAVLLAVGYRIFLVWLNEEQTDAGT